MGSNESKKEGTRFNFRRFQPKDELPLMSVWREAYPALFHFKYPARWCWNMFENPFVPEKNRPLCWVAEADAEIAAWTCAMAVPITAGSYQVIGGHSVDTYTIERFRNQGLGKKLQELNQSEHLIFISIDPSSANRRNKYKLGGYPGKPLETWLRIGSTLDRNLLYDSFLVLVTKYCVHPIKVFISALRYIGLAQLLNIFCSTALKIRQGKGKETITGGEFDLIFEEIDEFSEETDLLWSRIALRYSFSISRDSTYLNWKYFRQPGLQYCKVLARRNGTPVGLVVYRFPNRSEQRIGIISECFCLEDDPLLHSALIRRAMEDFTCHGIDLIKCGASTGNQRKVLHDLGFGLVDIDVPVFHVSPKASNLDFKTIMAKDWLLSLGDSDIDQVRPMQQPGFVEICRLILGKVPGKENLP